MKKLLLTAALVGLPVAALADTTGMTEAQKQQVQNSLAQSQKALQDAKAQSQAAEAAAKTQLNAAQQQWDASGGNMTAEQKAMVDAAMKDAQTQNAKAMQASADAMRDAEAQLEQAKQAQGMK